MPQIDLPPSKYRWRRPLSKPLAWAYVALGSGMLFWVFSVRDNVSTESLFTAAAFVAFCVGVIVAAIFRDVD